LGSARDLHDDYDDDDDDDDDDDEDNDNEDNNDNDDNGNNDDNTTGDFLINCFLTGLSGESFAASFLTKELEKKRIPAPQ